MQLLVTSSFYQFTQNCTDVFNAAEEAKLCSRPENYEGNPDPSRTCAFRRLQPWRRRCAGLTCSSISLMGDAAIENLSKVQGPAAPGALLLVFCPGNSLTKSSEFLENGVSSSGPDEGP